MRALYINTITKIDCFRLKLNIGGNEIVKKYLEDIGWHGSLWGDAAPKATDFYFDHWRGTLSNKKEDFEYQDGKDKFYRGDCIYSEKTVLGNKDPSKDREHNWRLLRSIKMNVDLTDSEIGELILKTERYRRLFPTLANFMPLWRLGINNSTNMNLAKGNWTTYRDFPDLWFRDIQVWYNDPEILEKKNRRTYDLFK